MIILINASEDMILQEVAQHMRIELDNPRLLYEIENPDLAAVAIALGGRIFVSEAAEDDREPIGILPTEPDPEPGRAVVKTVVRGTGKAKPLTLTETVKTCVICGEPVHIKRHKTCSAECEAERKKRYNRDYQRKLHEKAVSRRPQKDKPVETGDAVSEPPPLSPSI
ncbi:MAG TPA: hypothetical protein DCZ08_03605 [Anaerolineaceae bacterium]|nr:hypothetical protein [Anaerolineaceae bacterium]